MQVVDRRTGVLHQSIDHGLRDSVVRKVNKNHFDCIYNFFYILCKGLQWSVRCVSKEHVLFHTLRNVDYDTKQFSLHLTTRAKYIF